MTQDASPVADDPVAISRELFDFLMGTGGIDGAWFGDKHVSRPGAFWWRGPLNDFDAQPTPAPVTIGNEESVEARADKDWLAEQLKAWPRRVDLSKTINIEYLMQEAAKRIEALTQPAREQADRMRGKVAAALAEIQGHAKMANDVIRLKRMGTGGGRVKIGVCLHHIERLAVAALSLTAQPNMDHAEEERQRDAWTDFEGNYLTDGSGYAALSVYDGCRGAFDLAWPQGADAAEKAAYDALPENWTFGVSRSLATPPVNQDAVRESKAKRLYDFQPHIHSEQPDGLKDGEWLTATWEQLSEEVREGYRSQIDILSLSTPPLDNTGLDAATVLDWLTENPTLELSHYQPVYCDEDDGAVEWRVHRRSGSINDREWTIVGVGETPLAALTAARGQS